MYPCSCCSVLSPWIWYLQSREAVFLGQTKLSKEPKMAFYGSLVDQGGGLIRWIQLSPLSPGMSVSESSAVGWSGSSFRIGQMCEYCVLGTAAAEIS